MAQFSFASMALLPPASKNRTELASMLSTGGFTSLAMKKDLGLETLDWADKVNVMPRKNTVKKGLKVCIICWLFVSNRVFITRLHF